MSPDSLPKFKITELENLDFGGLDGEKDELLSSSFIPTQSIQKFLKLKSNYVLSPKGGGKSALFNMFNFHQEELKIYFNESDKLSLLPISEAFIFESKYLDNNKIFNQKESQGYTISWALYILNKLLKDIFENHSEKPGIDKVKSKFSKIEEFKKDFKLYNILERLKKLHLGIAFTITGYEVEVNPKISINEELEELNINKLFEIVNEFYKENRIKAVVSIDRLDNFVRKESYQIQKKYIQGLIDAIEEIRLCSNIIPILFIRTDLYHSSEIDIEYDKVKERTLILKWEPGETLFFILFRFLANEYIRRDYYKYLQHCITSGKEESNIKYETQKYSFLDRIQFWKKRKPPKIDLRKNLSYNIAEKFIKLFLPHYITVEDVKKIDTSEWIFNYFTDANDFVNPRLLIRFLNLLAEEQINFQRLHNTQGDEELKVVKNGGFPHYNIFTNEVIEKVYDQLQNEELKNIHKILGSRTYHKLFKLINSRTITNDNFKMNSLQSSKTGIAIEKEDLERFIKYIQLLGYCKEVELGTFNVPNLYKRLLDLKN